MVYHFDFGDDWWHDMVVMDLFNRWAISKIKMLHAAVGHSPPEDEGGPHCFAKFKQAIANTLHPSHHL